MVIDRLFVCLLLLLLLFICSFLCLFVCLLNGVVVGGDVVANNSNLLFDDVIAVDVDTVVA